jgi:acetyl-CoA synthetase
MSWQTIEKPPELLAVQPNLRDYEQFRQVFSWEEAIAELDGLPDNQGLNIAYEAVDRHADGSRADHLALRWISKQGHTRDFTYADLRDESNRFANVLKSLGVGPGDAVFTLTGRIPELYITALGTWKNRSIYCPLFSAFGPEPIHQRLERGNCRVLVTTESLYRRKVQKIPESLPSLEYVLIVRDTSDGREFPGTLDYRTLQRAASNEFEIGPTDPEDVALLHFTSGTTGMPKGAVHVHKAVVAHYITGKYALDFHPDDIFWCTADPGWVTGTSYGIIAPLTNGITSIVDEEEFDAERWYAILQDQRVTIWYTAPTAIRMLMKLGTEATKGYDLSRLRFIASVGEPLNPEAVVWGKEAFGLPIHDNWWQTETGGIMIANFASTDIHPGSMGRPLPGITAGIVQRNDDDSVTEVTQPGQQGELALRPGWPSMFRAYLNDEARYHKCFADGWYLTGDLAARDEDGYFWFVGRADDVIKSSGHLIGPFEVESCLMEHPDVVDAGVIGKPDPIAGEIVKAFVVLKAGIDPNEDTYLSILGFARKRLGAVVAPREIEFIDLMPVTRSGKVMRRLLKARELGLPIGDTSTLETGMPEPQTTDTEAPR